MLDEDDVSLLLNLLAYARGIIYDGLPTATAPQVGEAVRALKMIQAVDFKLQSLVP